MAFAKSTFKVKCFVIFRQTVATCRGSLDISFHLQKLPMYFWDFRINWQLVEIIFHLFWKAQCVAILSKVFFPTCQGSMLGSRPHCRSVPPVPVWLEEPVSQVRQSLVVVPRTIHPFPSPKPPQESWLSKPEVYYQCVFRHRRRNDQHQFFPDVLGWVTPKRCCLPGRVGGILKLKMLS